MPFLKSGFKTSENTSPAIATGEVKKFHVYTTNDTLDVVAAANYFNPVAGLISTGDLILVSGDVNGTPAVNCYVATKTGTNITVVGFATVTQTYNANDNYVLNTTVSLTDGDSGYVVVPKDGVIKRIDGVLLGGAITTNDAVCTFKIGTTAISEGVLTFGHDGSAIGDLEEAEPDDDNDVEAGNLVKCTVSGTPGGTRTAYVSILVDATVTA